MCAMCSWRLEPWAGTCVWFNGPSMKRTVVVRVLATLTSLSLVISLLALFSTNAAAANTVAPPICKPGQLSVALGKVLPGIGENDTETFSVVVKITNTGSICSIGGLPKIAPTGVEAKRVHLADAVVDSTKFRVTTVRTAQAVYTVLGYWWTAPASRIPGTAAARREWDKSCAPAKATGFTITIIPSLNLKMRHVKFTLPEVCTTGKVNMSTEPLVAQNPL